jgi:hypothetical protein
MKYQRKGGALTLTQVRAGRAGEELGKAGYLGGRTF